MKKNCGYTFQREWYSLNVKLLNIILQKHHNHNERYKEAYLWLWQAWTMQIIKIFLSDNSVYRTSRTKQLRMHTGCILTGCCFGDCVNNIFKWHFMPLKCFSVFNCILCYVLLPTGYFDPSPLSSNAYRQWSLKWASPRGGLEWLRPLHFCRWVYTRGGEGRGSVMFGAWLASLQNTENEANLMPPNAETRDGGGWLIDWSLTALSAQ